MAFNIQHVKPEDIFVSCCTQNRNDGSKDGGRRLCIYEPMNIIAALIHERGHILRRDVARLLNIDERVLSHGIAFLSGLPFNEWRDRYLMLMHNYIVAHEKDVDTLTLSHRLGFQHRSSRLRFERRMKKSVR